MLNCRLFFVVFLINYLVQLFKIIFDSLIKFNFFLFCS
ncbi:hypothetical protein BBU29805_0456 [Borreliella burgdorferi 29805]|nr:hypothetical protein BBU29805_0456 [Borreliella burgdorferi 29805]